MRDRTSSGCSVCACGGFAALPAAAVMRAKGYLARRNTQEVQRKRAANKIRQTVRGWLTRVAKFQRLRTLITSLQAYARGCLIRRLQKDKRTVEAAITVQRFARGYLARRRVNKIIRHIVICQAAMRGFLARRRYMRMRKEAPTMGRVKSVNKEDRSVWSVEETRPASDAVNWSAGSHNGSIPVPDAGMVVRIKKIQKKILELQREVSSSSKCAGNMKQRFMTQMDLMIKQLEKNRDVRVRMKCFLSNQGSVNHHPESCWLCNDQTRLLIAKLKDVGILNLDDFLERTGKTSTRAKAQETANTVEPQNASMAEMATATNLVMFEYKVEDEGKIIKKLILDLKPRVALTFLPGLPAYVIFMMLRHTDHVDDEPKMHQLMRAVRDGVRKTLTEQADSVAYSVLWFTNMVRLLNILTQYSGEVIHQKTNTPRQNQHILRYYDLSEYRRVFRDFIALLYQDLIQLLENQVEGMLVSAILEHEQITGLPGPARQRPSPHRADPARLHQKLRVIHGYLHTFAVDTSLRVMIFKQLFYFICTYSLNRLLLRKDLCSWTKGLQIRFNISHLEVWIKEHLAVYGQSNMKDILSTLRPITEAVYLLHTRKSMDDVQRTVDMCPNLTAIQVCRILKMYTPFAEYDMKVRVEFIREVYKKIGERPRAYDHKDPLELLMNSRKVFPIQLPYCSSPVRLEDIELPDVLGLEGLLTKI